MNRAERRRLEKKGVKPPKEPVVTLKVSELLQKKLTPTVQTFVNQEIHRQLLEKDKLYTLDMDTMVLWTLSQAYGFGPKRLKKFYTTMFKEHLRMRQFYEMGDTYPERLKLKEKGVDVETWYNELFNDKGEYREGALSEEP